MDDPVSLRDPSGLLAEERFPSGAATLQTPAQQQENAGKRGAIGQAAHEVGVGMRGVVDGVLGMGDTLVGPVRLLLNAINSKMGGDPNWIKPMAGTVSNAVGLPTPETDAEHRAYQINSFVAPLVAGGSAAVTQAGQRMAGAAMEAGTRLMGRAAAAVPAAVQGARTAANEAKEAAPVIMQGARATASAVKDGLPGISATVTSYVPPAAQRAIGKAADFLGGWTLPGSPDMTSDAAKLGFGIKGAIDWIEVLKEYLQQKK